jgi:plastocyanin
VVVRRLAIPAMLLLAVGLVGLTGCNKESGGDVNISSSTVPAIGVGPVTIKGVAFNPKEVHVKVGETLIWNWEDGGLEHTATADDKSFDSGRRAAGSFQWVFKKAGTVPYHCEVHSKMHGTVVVGA